MPTKIETLTGAIGAALDGKLRGVTVALGEVTIVVAPDQLLEVMRALRDRPELRFEILVELCGVDYPA